ncbi:MAG TPA: hypothetical protein PKK99_09475, partial [Bacteroidia bacterium]|nr:hypothetical protein [Bacteroidia bacterium]
MFKNTGYKNITEEEKHLLSRQELVVFNLAYMQHGALMWAPFALSDEETKILLRFAKVFEQTYTRFLDLQKAEAQAREAQIELALERVRARTMAMQKSDELAETAYLFFQQFKELGQNPEQFTIGLINEKERMMEFWHTWQGSLLSGKVQISIDEPHVGKNIYKVWKTQKNAAVIDISGTELQEYNAYRKKQLAKANAHAYDDFLGAEKRRVIHVSSFSKGIVSVASHEPQPLETIQLLERFATVFDQT